MSLLRYGEVALAPAGHVVQLRGFGGRPGGLAGARTGCQASACECAHLRKNRIHVADSFFRPSRRKNVALHMPERVPAIKVLLLPKDTNALGTIFGGVILAHVDLASAVEARKTAPHRYVTKAMNAVEFHAPVDRKSVV